MMTRAWGVVVLGRVSMKKGRTNKERVGDLMSMIEKKEKG